MTSARTDQARLVNVEAVHPKKVGSRTVIRTGGVQTLAIRSSSGRIVRLSDPEMRSGIEDLKNDLTNDPGKARQWLQDLGYLTPGGRVSRRYGGR